MISLDTDASADWLAKYAGAEEGRIPPPPEAGKSIGTNFKALEGLFAHQEGLAPNVKQELNRYFDLSNPAYRRREQTLKEKVACILPGG